MKYFCVVLAMLALVGCKERLDEGAELEKKRAERKEGHTNVNGKLVKNPPAGISEVMVEVEGKWLRAADENVTWHIDCGSNACKPKLGPKPKATK